MQKISKTRQELLKQIEKMKNDPKELEKQATFLYGLRSGIVEQITGWVFEDEEP